ncbi:MAG TPA: hypothetical protein VFZ84_01365 [Burkholderiales bacterium]
MYKGVVSFEAEIGRGVGIRFPKVAFRSPAAGVEKVEIEAVLDEAGNNSVSTAVHLEGVPTQQTGLAIARVVTTSTLNRLAFNQSISIGTPRCTKQEFEAIPQRGLDQVSGWVLVAGATEVSTALGEMKPVLGLAPDLVRAHLEETTPAGEGNYGLFRSARQSESRAEEFLHLYLIILMLCGDAQDGVDAWIKSRDPNVAETPSPDPRKKGRMETVYTRLRNEFGHKRAGVDLDNTKKEMSEQLERLRELARVAIRTLT